MRKAVISTLVAALIIMAATAGGNAADYPESWWTTRGGSSTHGNVAVEPFGTLAFTWEVDDIGLSASQPLYVDGSIYHLTEKGLWRITFDSQGMPVKEHLVPGVVQEIRVGNETRPAGTINHFYDGEGTHTRAPTAGLTYANVGPDRRPALYFGTGSNMVCAMTLDTTQVQCKQLFGTNAIVSTPLVFEEHDVVVMGDKEGYLWAVKGLATSNSIRYDLNRQVVDKASTWITSSATTVFESQNRLEFLFSAYVPGGGRGLVGRARVEVSAEGQPLLTVSEAGPFRDGLWTFQLDSMHGIADGFSLNQNGTLAYVNDLKGYMYSLGVQNRKTQVCPEATAPETTETEENGCTRAPLRFANEMAAVDSTGQTVYFTMRNVGTDRESFTEPGSIVAIDISDWTRKKWEAFLEAGAGAANTPPLVWGDVVLVGTTKGSIYGFDRNTGQPKSFAVKRLPLEFVDQDTSDGTKMGLLKRGEVPYQAQYAYQALSGAGVQPIVASGGTGETLLLMGVNYCQGAAPCAGNGRLMAFRALTDDPHLSGVSCPPTAMQWFDGAVHMGFRSTRSASFTGTLELTVNGTSKPPVPVSIPPGGSFRQPLRIEGQGPGTVTVSATLVPANGVKDSDLTNNKGSCTVTVTDCPDCALPPPTGPGAVIIGP